MIKLNAKQLRTTTSEQEQRSSLEKNPLYIICDNIIDTYNVGSIFRLADAVAAKKVLLCGITETPPNTRIKKASINTTEWVDWEYFPTTEEAIDALRREFSANVIASRQFGEHSTESVKAKQSQRSPREQSSLAMTGRGIQIVAVEQSSKSVPFDKAEYQFPLALIVSNESNGATREVLDKADLIVEMPMFGVNKSLNVMVSLGIVLYQVIQKLPR